MLLEKWHRLDRRVTDTKHICRKQYFPSKIKLSAIKQTMREFPYESKAGGAWTAFGRSGLEGRPAVRDTWEPG